MQQSYSFKLLLMDPIAHLVDEGDHDWGGKFLGGSRAPCDNPSDHRVRSPPCPPPSPGSIALLEKPAIHHCLSVNKHPSNVIPPVCQEGGLFMGLPLCRARKESGCISGGIAAVTSQARLG